MTEIPMIREGNRLVPVDQASSDDLMKIPLKTQVMVKITQPRNLKAHRLLWALASKVADACDYLQDSEDAMDLLKIKARHVRYIHDHYHGETRIVPKSIRFASLDQQKFSRLFNRMIHIVITEILPGMNEGELRTEIENMVGINIPDTKLNGVKRKLG